MKKIVFCFLLFFLFFPHKAHANGAGLPPFFKVNGKLSIANPLQIFGITASTFLLPQDFAPENYVVNRPIDFEIDESSLRSVIVGASLKDIQYKWDFRDGASAEGIKNTHKYTKIGSYILTLFINIYYKESPTPTQFIDSFLINIIPDNNYQGLPKAVIKINGTKVPDPLKSSFEADLNNIVTFDASDSKAPSSKLVEYLWNFGDGQTGAGEVITHQYNKPFNTAVSSYGIAYDEIAVLRVKDTNGFFSDAFVGVRNNPKAKNASVTEGKPSDSSDKSNNLRYIYIVIAFIIVAVGLIFVFRKMLKTKK